MDGLKNKVEKMNGVSVIVCYYNAAERITPTLQHLQEQVVSNDFNWELILVDNASTDDTEKIVHQQWNKKPVTDLKLLKEPKPGLMHARKKGLAHASYDIVSFIDDDNYIESSWVQKVFNIFLSDEKIGACGGKSEAVFEKEKPDWFETYQNAFAVGKQAEQSGIVDDKKGFLWGAGLSFRKKIWLELQQRGFKNLTIGRQGKNITAGEDTELCYAIRLLGYHLYYSDDLTLKHFMPSGRMNVNYLLKQSEGFGNAFARLNSYKILLNKTFKLYPWWYEWMAAKKRIFFLSLSCFFLSNEKKLKVRAEKAYLKGYAQTVWFDKNAVKENISMLLKCFNGIRN